MNIAPEEKPHQLKELVMKLNDRNIQRQRESGLTIYAMYGAIIYIVFYLVKNFPAFYKEECRADNFVTSAIVLNLALCIGYFIIHLTLGKNGENKVYPNEGFLDFDPSMIPIWFFVVLAAYFNLFSYSHSYSHPWIFLVFGLFHFGNALLSFGVFLYEKFRTVRKELKMPSFVEFSKDLERPLFPLFLYGITLFFILALVSMFSEKVDISDDIISDTILFDFHILGLLAVSFMLFEMIQTQQIHDGLEELEKTIYLENLSNDQIKIRLEEEYFGQNFKTWTEAWDRKIQEYFSQLKTKLLAIQNDLQAIQNDDIPQAEKLQRYNWQFEYKKRLTIELQDYNRDFLRMIKNLRTFASLEMGDHVLLFGLERKYNTLVAEVNAMD